MRSGEGATALLLAANLFVILFAYYLLKTAREVLILGVPGGRAEVKAYAAAAQAIVLVVLSLAFGVLARRANRLQLVAAVTGFFATNLLAFYALFRLYPAHALALGVVFFVWLGCFNVLIVAQFWSVANDLYRRDDGERLFPLIAVGSAAGGLAGARFSKPLFDALGSHALLLVGAGALGVSLALTAVVDRRRPPLERRARVAPSTRLSLLLADGYLRWIALLTLIKNWVNTTGEYVLDRRLLEVARAQANGTAHALSVQAYVAQFKSDYLTWVNALVLVLQLFVVSRVIARLGVGRALLVLPIVALAGYGTATAVPVLSVLMAVKIVENGVEYSLEKTSEQALYLVTSRAAKYRAKAVIDTVIVRTGDVLSAITVYLGVHAGLSTVQFLLLNVALVSVWIAAAARLVRERRRRVAAKLPARGVPAPA